MHILTVIAAADHAAKIAGRGITAIRKRVTRTAAPLIVAHRNGTTTQQAIRSGELVTVTTHLAKLNADEDTQRRYGSNAGKKIKAAYIARTGVQPRQIWTVSSAGYPIQVCAYLADDEALNAGVRAYPRIAHLVAA